MTSEWIIRLAADERRRDDERASAAAALARRVDIVRVHGQRLIDELRATVQLDLEAFRSEFPGDAAHEVNFEATEPGGGFVIRKPSYPAVALSVTPNLPAESVRCEYRFMPNNGLPSRDDRVDLRVVSNGNDTTLLIKHPGTGQAFNNANALSEYLLVPVLTGRPR
ncbi:MAG TPA: hypothetical protein VEU08_00955 [Vicinamibacterales bacterium]|nr:hypothetical protein [Vicinamibacterales bacterium]